MTRKLSATLIIEQVCMGVEQHWMLLANCTIEVSLVLRRQTGNGVFWRVVVGVK